MKKLVVFHLVSGKDVRLFIEEGDYEEQKEAIEEAMRANTCLATDNNVIINFRFVEYVDFRGEEDYDR